MTMCQRCERRPATHRLVVESTVRDQCPPCAAVGGQMAVSFGLTYSVRRLEVEVAA